MKNRRLQILSAGMGLLAMAIFAVAWMSDELWRPSAIVSIVSGLAASFFGVWSSRIRERQLRGNRVFLIHTKQDVAVTKLLEEILSTNGFEIWTSEKNLLPGQLIQTSIEEALENSGVAIVLLSKGAEKSSWLLHELAFARQAGLRILPIKLDDAAVPAHLNDIQWLDIRAENFNSLLLNSLSQRTSGQHQW